MTYKDIDGLNKYRDIYRSFVAIEEGLNKCKAEIDRGNRDDWSFRNTLGHFRTIISAILQEFKKKYPDCEGRDERNNPNTHATIIKIASMGLINEPTKKLFSTVNYLGNIGDHPEMSLPTYSKVIDTYDQLLCYMPTFLKGIPELKKPESKDTNQKEQIRYVYVDKPAPKRRGMVAIIIILVTALVIACIYGLYQTVQTRNQRANAQSVEKELNELKSIGTVTEVDVEEEGELEVTGEAEDTGEEPRYGIGETWVVDGQWEFTIDGVTSSPYEFDNSCQAIIINYHYTNLGYGSSTGNGLSFSLRLYTLVDANGIVASYFNMPTDIVYPQEVMVGGTWTAQAKFIIYSSSVRSATITIGKQDGNRVSHSAVFDLSW